MMTAEQREQIIAAVASGMTWYSASEQAGVPLGVMFEAVTDGRRVDGNKADQQFLAQLKQAGRVATESSLKRHRERVDTCAMMN